MADIENLATVALTIDGTQGQAAVQGITTALTQMGTVGDAAQEQLTAATEKTNEVLTEQYATLRDAQKAWVQQANADNAAVAAARQRAAVAQQQIDLDRMNIQQIEQFTAAMNANTQAAASNAQATMASAAAASAGVAGAGAASSTATAGFNLAGAGLGRLRMGFSTLASQMVGVSPIIGRVVSTLTLIGGGSGVALGAVAAIAAIGYAMHKLSEDARQLAEDARKAADELGKLQNARTLGAGEQLTTLIFGDPVKNPQGGGGIETAIKNDQDKIDNLKVRIAAEPGGENGTGLGLALMKRDLVTQENLLAEDIQKRQQARDALKLIQQQQTASQEETQARELADLIKHNSATAEQRAAALAILQADRAKLAELQKQNPGDAGTQRKVLTQESNLQRPIDALQDALFPKSDARSASTAARDIETISAEISRMKKSADEFGADASIDTRVQAIVDRIMQLEHTKGFETQTAALERLKGAAEQAGAALRDKVTQQFNQKTTDNIAVMDQTIARQKELTAVQGEGQKAIDQLTVKMAGQAAQEAFIASADKANQAFQLADVKAIRERAEAIAQGKIDETDAASSTELATHLQQQALDMSVATDAGYRLIAAHKAGRAAEDDLMVTLAGEQAVREAINDATQKNVVLTQQQIDTARSAAEAHQRMVNAQNAQKTSAKDLSAELQKVVGAFHNIADVANIMGNGGLANVLNTAGNAVGNIGNALSVGKDKGFMSLAAITPDIAAITSVVAIASEIFGKGEVQKEWKQVMDQNNQALYQVALKLDGFQVAAGNTAAAGEAIRAFESDSGASGALNANVTQKGGLFSGHMSSTAGGDLQSQIDALKPYLNQAFGATSNMTELDDEFRKLDAIAKQYNITLTDAQGRIIPDQLAKLGTALDAAGQAAFTLGTSFSELQNIYTLDNALQGKTDARSQYDAAIQAFQKTTTGTDGQPTIAGQPTGSADSQQGMNQWRSFLLGEVKQVEAGTLDYKQLGNFTSLQDFLGAVQAITGPLNSLTDTVNGVTDSFTNVPSGFKAEEDRFAASLPGNPNGLGIPVLTPSAPVLTPGMDVVGPMTPTVDQSTASTSALAPLTTLLSTLNTAAASGGSGTGSTSGLATLMATLNGSATAQESGPTFTGPITVNVTSTAANAKDLMADIAQEFENMSLRGGTNQIALALKGR